MQSVSGYLEIHSRGFGFLRELENNFRPTTEDIYVPAPLIRKYQLREGLHLSGTVQNGQNNQQKNNRLLDVKKINGNPLRAYSSIRILKDQTSINPEERLRLQIDPGDRMGKILDMISPIGKGQRGLIIAAPKTGKTTILKHIARAIEANHPDMLSYILLVDERPEEVTDFRRSLKTATVLSSSADESVTNHLRMTRLAMHTAIRQAEFGKDVVVLIDSLTRMARAFNKDTESHSRTLTGGLGANALELPRRFFGAARNLEHGGSLTVIATILVDTGSKMDDIIFQEFKGTGNLDLVLSKVCAERRIFPAINLNASGTRKEHLLFAEDEMRKVNKLRRFLAQLNETEAMTYLMEHLDEL